PHVRTAHSSSKRSGGEPPRLQADSRAELALRLPREAVEASATSARDALGLNDEVQAAVKWFANAVLA
ncbi:MAG: hypothetical protein SGPRY_004760, partial [Prymnesium sp.]